jgi:hypothetical protein
MRASSCRRHACLVVPPPCVPRRAAAMRASSCRRHACVVVPPPCVRRRAAAMRASSCRRHACLVVPPPCVRRRAAAMRASSPSVARRLDLAWLVAFRGSSSRPCVTRRLPCVTRRLPWLVVSTLRDSSPPCLCASVLLCLCASVPLFSSLGFYERSASAGCSRRATHALRRLDFRFLKESESDLLDARSGLWSAAFASREESKSKWRPGHPVVSSLYAARISYPITRRRPTGLQLIVCARAAPRLAEGFMPVAPARAVTTWSTLRARFSFRARVLPPDSQKASCPSRPRVL